MFGLDLIMAGWLATQHKPMIEPVRQAISCQTRNAPRINVLPSKSRVRYDFSKRKAQLNAVDVDTISPYGPHHKTEVSGLMSGSIQVKHEMRFEHQKYMSLDLGCLYIRSVDVSVHIEPTVFVAAEYAKGTCMHNAILAHEHKHVREDQLIVNKYTKIIGRAMQQAVNSQGASFGPYELDRISLVQQNIQNALNGVLKKYNDRMNLERRDRQQAIDSFEEYESIGKRCPKERR